MNISTIMLATDFSRISEEAQATAVWLRDQLNGELHVVHVYDRKAMEVPPPYYFMPGVDHWLDERFQEMEKAGRDALKNLCAEIGHCQGHFLEGKPGPVLIQFARDHHVDLTVLGTHGHRGWDRVVLGSVAEYVIRHGGCGVLTVKPGA